MALVAGIDVGTQSTKVVCYDTVLQSITAHAQAPHELVSRDDGTREQQASWWIDAIRACFQTIPREIRDQIEAIGVSGQQHGFVPMAADGTVLHPVKLWNDTSTTDECDIMTKYAGGNASLLAEEGNLVLPGYTAPKILWLKHHHPELYEQMATILLPHDYINWYLTGNRTMEYGDASGTALLDIRTRTWSDRMLKAVDAAKKFAACLPRLIGPDQPSGTVTEKAAREFGIPQGILVSSGGGDNMMGAIGTGTVVDGTLTMSLGTSGTLYGASDKPIIDPNGLLAAFCSSTGGWLPLLCTMNCTVASETTRSLFGKGVKEFDEIAMQSPIGAAGLVMLPYFNGERTPNYPRGKGCIMGFNLENMTEANISRAAMESAIYGLRLGLESFESLGYRPREIRLIGGGAKSALWRQMAADVFSLPVVVPSISEAAALGGALQAFWALERQRGSSVSIQEIVASHVVLDTPKSCMPDAKNTAAYQEAYTKYLSYVQIVKPIFS